ncbi:hypothetical protein FACS189497_04040 [Betaproteobacteria bacterium]|nr:hypothetical protein FACS189488_10750 [Betaproteobacteria bacterium]GHU28477.1 hypothetical protein FACS189497_04040 [Betaproteobacteria bacterium]
MGFAKGMRKVAKQSRRDEPKGEPVEARFLRSKNLPALKVLMIFALCFCSLRALAGVTVKFYDYPINEFAAFVISELKGESFIMDNDFISAHEHLSVSLVDVDKSKVFEYLDAVLSSSGYEITTRNKLHYITKKSSISVDQDIFVYRPKYRSAEYLRELAGTLFDRMGFVGERSVSNPSESFGATGNAQGINKLISQAADVVVYRGSEKDIQKMQKLFAQIDFPAGDLLVRAVVYEVRKDKTDKDGMSLAFGLLESLKGVGVRVDLGTVDSGNQIRIKGSSLDAVWSALSSDSRFKVVSSPSLRVRSGSKASFMVGEEVPTLGGTTYNGAGQSSQSIVYKSSGVILELSPHVRGEVVDLDIMQEVSSFTMTQTGVSGSPTLLKRQLKSGVSASSGDVIVLGGIESSNESKQRQSVSVLPDWFAGTSNDTSQTEILLVLHLELI